MKCLAKGHNTAPLRFKPAALRSSPALYQANGAPSVVFVIATNFNIQIPPTFCEQYIVSFQLGPEFCPIPKYNKFVGVSIFQQILDEYVCLDLNICFDKSFCHYTMNKLFLGGKIKKHKHSTDSWKSLSLKLISLYATST